ncbi:MAG: hypothetical protein K6U80_09015 [Firmicutes bacterium]|nr:hypothetical protein [Bacillota bacterium]
MHNKLLTVIFAMMVLFSAAVTAHGAVTLESVLVQINSSGRNNFSYFRTQISLTYNIPVSQVDYYYISLRMAPADIYMTLELAAICRIQPVRVIEVYRIHRGRGWGYIARQLGIKPGSREFKRLMDRGNSFHQKTKNKKSKTPPVYNVYSSDDYEEARDYRDPRNK